MERFLDGTMSEKEMREMGVAWTPQLVARQRAKGASLAVIDKYLRSAVGAAVRAADLVLSYVRSPVAFSVD